MPPTPPPQKSAAEIRSRQPKLRSKMTRMAISFLLGAIAFLVLLVVSGNKSLSEVAEMITGMF